MEESRDHLLCQCPYTNGTWQAVLCMCNLSRFILPWSLELQWLVDHSKGKTFSAVLRKIAAAATVYHIWMERNRRIFRNGFLPQHDIILKIRAEVVCKFKGLGPVMDSEKNRSLGENWGINMADLRN
ncbi:hypothetical protein CFOL_v3_28922 [Cephalotus follicularis]|uniref:Zf-RVT domain-containing protein n=1 Tax=Cephalotus follicularis TaxID=3775 RepID=A0A1Q3CZ15_CEPFO|nr:hypothetical protein CFOL_v3_28922 [Cephalotus follicularis]